MRFLPALLPLGHFHFFITVTLFIYVSSPSLIPPVTNPESVQMETMYKESIKWPSNVGVFGSTYALLVSFFSLYFKSII